MSEEKAKELGVKPMATWVAGALGGVDPKIMDIEVFDLHACSLKNFSCSCNRSDTHDLRIYAAERCV